LQLLVLPADGAGPAETDPGRSATAGGVPRMADLRRGVAVRRAGLAGLVAAGEILAVPCRVDEDPRQSRGSLGPAGGEEGRAGCRTAAQGHGSRQGSGPYRPFHGAGRSHGTGGDSHLHRRERRAVRPAEAQGSAEACGTGADGFALAVRLLEQRRVYQRLGIGWPVPGLVGRGPVCSSLTAPEPACWSPPVEMAAFRRPF